MQTKTLLINADSPAGTIQLCKPRYEDLWFRQMLMADPETMSYNHAWGGTIPFPREQWQSWYDHWINEPEEARFYRYLQCDGAFVGEIAYHRDEKSGKYMANVIVLSKHRGKGYGAQGLSLLCEAARRRGVSTLYDDIAIDNPAVQLFWKAGFVEEYRTEQIIMLKKELDDGTLISSGDVSIRLMKNTSDDMHAVLRWLTHEQVVRWVYDEGAPWTLAKVTEEFGGKTEEGGCVSCFVLYRGTPVGYLQYYPVEADSYVFTDAEQFAHTAGGYGIDLFIGEPELWNRGIGSLAVACIGAYLKRTRGVQRLCVDPATDNERALHFWRKVGFEPLGMIQNYDDDQKQSILMMKTL